jgi:hypothetical protein
LVCWGCNGSSETQVINVNPAGVSAPAKIDLGVLPPGGHLTRNIMVRNESEIDGHIVDFQSSCECVSLAPSTITLKPGQRELCELTADLKDESSFTGLLSIEIDGVDKSDKTILKLVVLLDVHHAVRSEDHAVEE